jgi:hypothetical protein
MGGFYRVRHRENPVLEGRPGASLAKSLDRRSTIFFDHTDFFGAKWSTGIVTY